MPPDEPNHRDGSPPPFTPDWRPVFDPGAEKVTPSGRYHNKRYRNLGVRHVAGPTSEYQALMEAPPGQEPEPVYRADNPRVTAIHDAIDGLEPRLRWVAEAWLWRGLSLAAIAAELGLSKSHAGNLRAEVVKVLQGQLDHLIQPTEEGKA